MGLLFEDGVFFDDRQTGELDKRSMTIHFNIAVYLIIKDFNDPKSNKLAVKPENSCGNGRSDMLITSEDGKEEFIEIEHENDITNDKIRKMIGKLKASNAKEKLIIAYYFDKYTKEDIINDFKDYKNKLGFKDDELFLILAPYELSKGSQYEIV